MKKYLIVLVISIFFLGGCSTKGDDRISLIGSNFPCYDFLRAISKDVDGVSVKMLMPAGSDMHSYEPTPKDIIDIDKSDLFVYIGGESEEYVSDILDDLNKDSGILKLFDKVNLEVEVLKEGMETIDEEDEEEYDEHIWTSPVNAIKMLEEIRDKVIEIDSINKDKYIENTNNYIEKIKKIDSDIRNILENSKRKTIIFGDRFPLQYFANLYGIDYYAAFKGCSESVEASSKTISFLINKIKENDIKVIYKIELSNGNIANTISKETGAKVLEFNSLHNISKTDFDSGKTYVDIMENNVINLEEGLNL